MFENTSIAIMYAVSPCHAGKGSEMGVIDNPIQRERHTNWPIIHASSVKGAIRANFDKYKHNLKDNKQFDDLTAHIFGTDKSKESDSGYASSCAISDARILAYPMRSDKAPFVWITCPAVLTRLCRDLEIARNETIKLPDFSVITEDSSVSVGTKLLTDQIMLEDLEVKAVENKNLVEKLSSLLKYFNGLDQVLIVPDEIFNYGVTNCTQILPQIQIDSKTGNTVKGSLRYQEELPSDTIMYTIIHWDNSRIFNDDNTPLLQAETIKKYVIEDVIKNHIQIAGDETCGRGIFQLTWY